MTYSDCGDLACAALNGRVDWWSRVPLSRTAASLGAKMDVDSKQIEAEFCLPLCNKRLATRVPETVCRVNTARVEAVNLALIFHSHALYIYTLSKPQFRPQEGGSQNFSGIERAAGRRATDELEFLRAVPAIRISLHHSRFRAKTCKYAVLIFPPGWPPSCPSTGLMVANEYVTLLMLAMALINVFRVTVASTMPSSVGPLLS